MTRRILFSYLSLTFVILLGLELPLGFIYAHHERDGFAAAVERDAVIMADRAGSDIAENRPGPVAALAGEYARRNGAQVLVVNSAGEVLSSSTPDAQAPGPELAAALADRHAVGYRSTASGESELYVAVPAHTGGAVRGALRITYPTDLVDASASRAWLGLLVAGVLTLSIVALVGFALARWIMRPVRALEDATTLLAEGAAADLPAADFGPPELRRLAVRLSDTSRRLHRLMSAQRSFTMVASHQLKSPLTALRLRLENLEPGLSQECQPNLEAAIAEVNRLTRMIQGLLALARLEDGAGDRDRVELDDLIADRVDSWAAYAAENQVVINKTGDPAGAAWAIPGAVEQILDNLLANAVRVAPPQTAITIACESTTQGVELHIFDQGPGLSEADRARAFDRFWRAPDSADDGSGLGLTIVRQLARACGGEAELKAAPGGGIDAVVRLKQAPAVDRRRATTPGTKPRPVAR